LAGTFIWVAFWFGILGALIAGAVAMRLRLRLSTGLERLQAMWLAWSAAWGAAATARHPVGRTARTAIVLSNARCYWRGRDARRIPASSPDGRCALPVPSGPRSPAVPCGDRSHATFKHGVWVQPKLESRAIRAESGYAALNGSLRPHQPGQSAHAGPDDPRSRIARHLEKDLPALSRRTVGPAQA
jgi:hypothetical protein